MSLFVNAEEDPVEDIIEGEDEDGDATVESDDGMEEQAVVDDSEPTEEEDEEKPLKPSPDADTYLLFTKPSTQGMTM